MAGVPFPWSTQVTPISVAETLCLRQDGPRSVCAAVIHGETFLKESCGLDAMATLPRAIKKPEEAALPQWCSPATLIGRRTGGRCARPSPPSPAWSPGQACAGWRRPRSAPTWGCSPLPPLCPHRTSPRANMRSISCSRGVSRSSSLGGTEVPSLEIHW